MKLCAIVQARMGSARFPGKILHSIYGKPLLEYVFIRLYQSKSLDKIIVATSVDEHDDLVAEYCREKKVDYFRGSLSHVASRFASIIEMHNLKYFVRICADSPLIDSRIIDQAAHILTQDDYDIVTNIFKRTFPKGQSVELFKASAFLKGYRKMKDSSDLEHVTPYFYRHADQFHMFNIELEKDCSKINMSVDIPHDVNFFKRVLDKRKTLFFNDRWEDMIEIPS